MAIFNKQSQWQEPSVWQMPPLKTVPPAPPRVVCWDDEVRTDPRAWLISSCQHGCVFVARLYGFVHGLNLWNSCASCPEWELCMSNCHLANPPTHPPTLRHRPSSLLLSLHQLRSQGYYRSWKSQIKGAILTYFQIFTLHPILEVGLAQFTNQRLLFLFAEVKFWKDNWYPCILINVDLFFCFLFVFFKLFST